MLIYTAICSLDGYIADENGNFDWAEPDDEVHAFVNDLARPVGTHLLGRASYEVMRYWDTADDVADAQSEPMRDFRQLWQAADKIVYSRTLESVSTARTRLERDFDPEAVRQLKAQLDRDMLIGGPNLAAHAIRAGLVDEYHLFLTPIIIGGGNPALPNAVRVKLDLIDQRRFTGGTMFLRYRGPR